jgi:hypothetical protein
LGCSSPISSFAFSGLLFGHPVRAILVDRGLELADLLRRRFELELGLDVDEIVCFLRQKYISGTL